MPNWNSQSKIFNDTLKKGIELYGMHDIESMKKIFPQFDRATIQKKISLLDKQLKRGEFSAEEDFEIISSMKDYPGVSRNTKMLASALNRSFNSIYSRENIVKVSLKAKVIHEQHLGNDYTIKVCIDELLGRYNHGIKNQIHPDEILFSRKDTIYQTKFEEGVKEFGLNPEMIKDKYLPEWPTSIIRRDMIPYTSQEIALITEKQKELMVLNHVLVHGPFRWDILQRQHKRWLSVYLNSFNRLCSRLSIQNYDHECLVTVNKVKDEIKVLENYLKDNELNRPRFTYKNKNLLAFAMDLFKGDIDQVQMKFFHGIPIEELLGYYRLYGPVGRRGNVYCRNDTVSLDIDILKAIRSQDKDFKAIGKKHNWSSEDIKSRYDYIGFRLFKYKYKKEFNDSLDQIVDQLVHNREVNLKLVKVSREKTKEIPKVISETLKEYMILLK
jgi:hypothetical protein